MSINLHKLIEIPQNASTRIEIISSNYKDFYLSELGLESKIYPSQPSVSKSQNIEEIPFIINEITPALFFGFPIILTELIFLSFSKA